MADIINWIRSTPLITGQYLTSESMLEDQIGNYVIQPCPDNLLRQGKDKFILDFYPYKAFRSGFSEMAEHYEEDGFYSYDAYFYCQTCDIRQPFDQSSPSGMESNDWTKIVTLLGFHLGHVWTFSAESRDEESNQYLFMNGLVLQ